MNERPRTTEEVSKEGSTLEERKTLLFYLLGLVGLVVVSILSASQIERVEIRSLPTYTPTIAITPQSTASLPVRNWIGEGYPPPKIGEYSKQPTAALTLGLLLVIPSLRCMN